MVMIPDQATHCSVAPRQSAALLLIFVVGDGGTQGLVVTGIHGAGVGTGLAIPAGFVGAMQVGNGTMFSIGIWSMTVAANLPSIITG